jgi:hypothetical protein
VTAVTPAECNQIVNMISDRDADAETQASQASEEARPLTPEARRALAEAEARRRQTAPSPEAPTEVGGRNGPEPTRFGDWETSGIVSDF